MGPNPVYAQDFRLPEPGQMVALSPAFSPAVLKGIKLDPNNPFRFHFFVESGDSNLSQGELKSESSKLIKYFLASLTIPEKDLWVNLSPYEKDRIVPQEFGQTEMGRDLLAEDYVLKQITASLIYPESQLGKEFWQKIYAKAQAKYGTTNIPVNTFNKVWIVPEKAVVYENGGVAFVLENHLKVMLEQDYLSLTKHAGITFEKAQTKDTNQLGSQIVREIVLPALTKEVNEGKNFSQLRQVFYSLILATWYKKKIKDSILNKVYSNKNKIGGVNVSAKDKDIIYQEYLKAFKKGVYNYIKEEPGPLGNEVIPRKYFSGGVNAAQISDDMAMVGLNKVLFNYFEHTKDILTEIDGTASLIGGQPMSARFVKPPALSKKLADGAMTIDTYRKTALALYALEPEANITTINDHARRVAELARLLGDRMLPDISDRESLEQAALIHDLEGNGVNREIYLAIASTLKREDKTPPERGDKTHPDVAFDDTTRRSYEDRVMQELETVGFFEKHPSFDKIRVKEQIWHVLTDAESIKIARNAGLAVSPVVEMMVRYHDPNNFNLLSAKEVKKVFLNRFSDSEANAIASHARRLLQYLIACDTVEASNNLARAQAWYDRPNGDFDTKKWLLKGLNGGSISQDIFNVVMDMSTNDPQFIQIINEARRTSFPQLVSNDKLANKSSAMLAKGSPEGGIDLNPAQMSMQVKEEGQDFKFYFNSTGIDAAQVTGATFIIHTMTSVTDLPLILGLSQQPADKLNQPPNQLVASL